MTPIPKELMQDVPNEIITGEVTAIVPMTTKDLQTRIAEETEQRRIITEFITTNMKPGVDYGTIKFTKRDGTEVESKPSLFKPGSEKFVSLFHFRPTFERDNDTWEMSGKVAGLFCYKCELVAANGAIVGEGRGTANLGEKQGWTANNAVKIAEKRAQIDAVLRTGGLSDFFTQDLEDMNISENHQQPQKPSQPVNRPEPTYSQLQGQITEGQKRAIFGSIQRFGVSEEELKKRFNIEHISKMSKQDASNLIDQLYRMKEW